MLVDGLKREKRHIARLLKQYNLTMTHRNAYEVYEHPVFGPRFISNATVQRDRSGIIVPEIDSEYNYCVALHEIGHLVEPDGWLFVGIFDCPFTSPNIFRRELAANRFVIKRSIVPLKGTEYLSFSWLSYAFYGKNVISQLEPHYRRLAKKIVDEKL